MFAVVVVAMDNAVGFDEDVDVDVDDWNNELLLVCADGSEDNCVVVVFVVGVGIAIVDCLVLQGMIFDLNDSCSGTK